MAQAFAGAPPAPFALNYTRKRPLRGHCARPYMKEPISLRLRLDFLDFHGKLFGHMFSRRAKQHELLFVRFPRQLHQGGTLYICPHALHETSQSVCALRA